MARYWWWCCFCQDGICYGGFPWTGIRFNPNFFSPCQIPKSWTRRPFIDEFGGLKGMLKWRNLSVNEGRVWSFISFCGERWLQLMKMFQLGWNHQRRYHIELYTFEGRYVQICLFFEFSNFRMPLETQLKSFQPDKKRDEKGKEWSRHSLKLTFSCHQLDLHRNFEIFQTWNVLFINPLAVEQGAVPCAYMSFATKMGLLIFWLQFLGVFEWPIIFL